MRRQMIFGLIRKFRPLRINKEEVQDTNLFFSTPGKCLFFYNPIFRFIENFCFHTFQDACMAAVRLNRNDLKNPSFTPAEKTWLTQT